MPIILLLVAPPAHGASSAWAESEGGAVRLITSGLPDESGKLSAALEIQLKPGWKTYWRNPGGAGIPPQIDVSRNAHVKAVQLEYPAPDHIVQGPVEWAGYKKSVSFPVTFTFDLADFTGLLDVDVFLGICESICIPFQASFLFDPAADADNPQHALIVQRARTALPAIATAQFGVRDLEWGKDGELSATVRIPPGTAEAKLFVDHSHSHLLGFPTLRSNEGGEARFTLETFSERNEMLSGSVLNYTLVADGEAVSGEIRIP